MASSGTPLRSSDCSGPDVSVQPSVSHNNNTCSLAWKPNNVYWMSALRILTTWAIIFIRRKDKNSIPVQATRNASRFICFSCVSNSGIILLPESSWNISTDIILSIIQIFNSLHENTHGISTCQSLLLKFFCSSDIFGIFHRSGFVPEYSVSKADFAPIFCRMNPMGTDSVSHSIT